MLRETGGLVLEHFHQRSPLALKDQLQRVEHLLEVLLGVLDQLVVFVEPLGVLGCAPCVLQGLLVDVLALGCQLHKGEQHALDYPEFFLLAKHVLAWGLLVEKGVQGWDQVADALAVQVGGFCQQVCNKLVYSLGELRSCFWSRLILNCND